MCFEGSPRAEWAIDDVIIAVNDTNSGRFQENFTPMNANIWYMAMNAVPKITCSSLGNALEFSKNAGQFKNNGILKKKVRVVFMQRSIQSVGPLKSLFALPDRPVHCDTNSASPGSILARQQLRTKTKSLTFPPLSIARYSFILSQLGHQWRERKCQIFETVAKGDSNPGSLDCESGVLPLSYRAPFMKCMNFFTHFGSSLEMNHDASASQLEVLVT